MKIFSNLFFLLLLSACVSSEVSYTTIDTKHLDLVVRLLDKRNIPYKRESDTITYSIFDENKFDEVLLTIRKSTRLRFEEESIREYLYAELEEQNIEYLIAQEGTGGEVVFWPDSNTDVDAILLKTIEFQFEQDIKNGKFSNECNHTSQTTPSARTHKCARF